jgi:FAD/FMN-containing dehydrogenase
MSELVAAIEGLLGPEGLAPPLALGGREVPVAAPADEESLLEILALARADGLCLIPVGRGSRVMRIRAGETPDLFLSTLRFTGVLAYEPGDGTLTARAGTPIGEMACHAAGGGHYLSPRFAHDPRATFGGLVAEGRSGLDRIRFGPLRHQLLGTRIALADGTVAASGGRLVKNVTGYDLHRLHCGSRGTLGVVLEACLRLYPAPDTSSTLAAGFGRVENALDAAERIRTGPLRPWGLVIEESAGDDGQAPWILHLELAGAEVVHAAEQSWARNLLEALGGEDTPPRTTDSLDRLIDGADAALAVTCRPSALERTRRLVAELVPGRQIIRPALAGVMVLGEAPSIEDPAWDRLCGQLADLDARITFGAHAADAPRDGSAGRDWSRRLRAALDPAGMFASAQEVR